MRAAYGLFKAISLNSSIAMADTPENVAGLIKFWYFFCFRAGASATSTAASEQTTNATKVVDPEPHRIRLMSWNIDGLDQGNIKTRAKSVAETINKYVLRFLIPESVIYLLVHNSFGTVGILALKNYPKSQTCLYLNWQENILLY